MGTRRWLGAAVGAAFAAGCAVAPGAASEDDLTVKYRAAHEGRDVYAALRLVHWDESTQRDHGEIVAMFEGLFRRTLRDLRVDSSTAPGAWNLIVECEGTQTEWVFPIGRFGGRAYLAFRRAP